MTSAQTGIVDKWFKKEGESFLSGDILCEISMDDFTVAVDSPRSGILASIIIPKGKEAEAGESIASYAVDKESYFKYVDSLRVTEHESELIADVEEINEESSKKPDAAILLREIKHLVKNGDIKDKSELSLYYKLFLQYLILKFFLKLLRVSSNRWRLKSTRV